MALPFPEAPESCSESSLSSDQLEKREHGGWHGRFLSTTLDIAPVFFFFFHVPLTRNTLTQSKLAVRISRQCIPRRRDEFC